MTSDPEVTQLRMFLDKLPPEPCDIKRPEEFCSICKKVNSQVYYECQKARRSKGLIIDSETQEKEYDIEELIKKVDEKIKGIPDRETKFEVVKEKEEEGVTTLEMDDPDRPMIEIIRPNYKKPDEAKFEVLKEEKAPVKFEHEAAPKNEAAPASEDEVKEEADKETEEDLAVFELAEPVKEKPKEKVKFQIAKKERPKTQEDGFWEGVNVEPVLEEGTVVSGTDEDKAKEKGGSGAKASKGTQKEAEDEEPLEVVPVEVLDDEGAEEAGTEEEGEAEEEDEADDGEVIVATVLEEEKETSEVAGEVTEAKVEDERPMVEFVKKKGAEDEDAAGPVKGEPMKEGTPTPKKPLKKKVKRTEDQKSLKKDESKVEATEVWVTDPQSPVSANNTGGAPASEPKTHPQTPEKPGAEKKTPIKPKVKKAKKA